jgi:microcystin degradation protein MlrC
MDVVPTLFAGALPSSTISSSAWNFICRRLLDRIASALPLDGVFLALHGAATVEGSDDPEANLLADIREAVGSIPFVVTVDLHANVSERLFQLADVLVAYDTYPHEDIFDRGAEAAHVLQTLLRGERITGAFRKLPLLTAPQVQGTDDEPMKSVLSCIHAAEQGDRVLTASVCPGYPYSDVPRLGAAVFVYTVDDAALADTIAGEIAQLLWNRRSQFRWPAICVSQAVASAIASVDSPVILVDSADNIGGGTPGDGTAILAELLDSESPRSCSHDCGREGGCNLFRASAWRLRSASCRGHV